MRTEWLLAKLPIVVLGNFKYAAKPVEVQRFEQSIDMQMAERDAFEAVALENLLLACGVIQYGRCFGF